MLDDKLKDSLRKLAPKILLLSYDQNRDVSDTMRELWSSLVDVEEEQKVITERWEEIYDEAYKGIEVSEYSRNKLTSVRALADLLPNRTWKEIKKNFRKVFLTCLASINFSEATLNSDQD